MGLPYTRSATPPFIVFWSEDVLAEVIYRLRRKHPDWDGRKVTALVDLIRQTFEVGRVEGYPMDPNFQGGDPDDAHVHAAALACGADIILTGDLTGFPENAPYEVHSPDEFFTLVDQVAPELVREVIRDQALYWLQRRGEADLPRALRMAGCPTFAKRVRQHLQTIELTSR